MNIYYLLPDGKAHSKDAKSIPAFDTVSLLWKRGGNVGDFQFSSKPLNVERICK